MSQTLEADAPSVAHDHRADQIGFVNELQRLHADRLKSALKCRMLDNELTRVCGDYFEGLLVEGTIGTVDPKKLFKMLQAGEISEKDFLGCVKVNREAALKIVAERDLDKLSTFVDATPSLRVTRIKGVNLELVEALNGLKLSE